jgi:hypothetical protein
MNKTNTVKRIKKGDRKLMVKMYGGENDGMIVVEATPVVVQSWGKQQGTATSEANGQFVRHQLYPAYTVLLDTPEDVRRYAMTAGIEYAVSTIENRRRWAVESTGFVPEKFLAKDREQIFRMVPGYRDRSPFR